MVKIIGIRILLMVICIFSTAEIMSLWPLTLTFIFKVKFTFSAHIFANLAPTYMIWNTTATHIISYATFMSFTLNLHFKANHTFSSLSPLMPEGYCHHDFELSLKGQLDLFTHQSSGAVGVLSTPWCPSVSHVISNGITFGYYYLTIVVWWPYRYL